jgi:hypothetical protein
MSLGADDPTGPDVAADNRRIRIDEYKGYAFIVLVLAVVALSLWPLL